MCEWPAKSNLQNCDGVTMYIRRSNPRWAMSSNDSNNISTVAPWPIVPMERMLNLRSTRFLSGFRRDFMKATQTEQTELSHSVPAALVAGSGISNRWNSRKYVHEMHVPSRCLEIYNYLMYQQHHKKEFIQVRYPSYNTRLIQTRYHRDINPGPLGTRYWRSHRR